MATIHAAGYNHAYQLALGDITNRNALTEIAGDWSVIRGAWGGQYFQIGIKSDGTLWSWGTNTNGQLGQGDLVTLNTPTQVGTDDTWLDIALNFAHVIAVKTNGTLWSWGLNTSAQLGLGHTTSPITTPTQIGTDTDWVAVAAGNSTGFAKKSAGTWYGWGLNANYQLGQGNTTSPITTPTLIGTFRDVYTHGLFSHAIKIDGTLWSWGTQAYGEQGTGDNATKTTPTQIGSGTDWALISPGYQYTHAIKTNGTLWGAGLNTSYQLGDGTNTNRTSFVQIGSATHWANAVGMDTSAVFLTTDGALWSVGNNTYGQLALGNNDNKTVLTASPFAETVEKLYRGRYSLYAVLASAPYVTAPIQITVAAPSYTASAPISIGISAEYSASAPISIVVDDTSATRKWSVRLMIGGSDLSARLAGAVTVDAEEGASRTAQCAIYPEDGALDPSDWLDVDLIIDLVRYIGGTPSYTRIFKGKIETVDIDLVSQSIRFAAADDLKNIVSNLSIEQIDDLTRNTEGLDYSPAALGPAPDDHWDYAQARMECVSGLLDLSVHGYARVTPFSGGMTSAGTFTEADMLDESLSLTLPQRSDIINLVEIQYEYRLYRCRERITQMAWSNTILGGTDSLASGYQSPSIDAVKSAVEGTGWHVNAASYQAGWAYVATSAPSGYSGSDWWIMATPNACGSMICEVRQRHAQPFTETYQISVRAPDSQHTYGTRTKTIRGALASEWDPRFWESDYSITTPDPAGDEIDYAGDQDRDMSDEAIDTLAMMARRIILASHRTTRVRFGIPCAPGLDLTQTATVDTDRLAAGGKIARIEHELDLNAGSATTYITIAVQGVGAWDESQENSVLTAPPLPPNWGPGSEDAETWVNDDWELNLPVLGRHVGGIANHDWDESLTGYLVNAPEKLTAVNFTTDEAVSFDNPYYAAGWDYPQTGFKIVMPGVAENYRQAPPIEPVTQERQCAIANANPLTLIIEA